MSIKYKEKRARPHELRQADGAFLTMTSMGVVEIESLDGRNFQRSPLVAKLWAGLRQLICPVRSPDGLLVPGGRTGLTKALFLRLLSGGRCITLTP